MTKFSKLEQDTSKYININPKILKVWKWRLMHLATIDKMQSVKEFTIILSSRRGKLFLLNKMWGFLQSSLKSDNLCECYASLSPNTHRPIQSIEAKGSCGKKIKGFVKRHSEISTQKRGSFGWNPKRKAYFSSRRIGKGKYWPQKSLNPPMRIIACFFHITNLDSNDTNDDHPVFLQF